MKCKKIRGLLLTDYLDGQMSQVRKADMEKHMAGCPACKKFSLDAEKIASGLFTNVEKSFPEDFIWHRIKEDIIRQGEKKPSFTDALVERLRGFRFIPKPALAFATALILLILSGVATKLIVTSQAPMGKYAEAFDYVTGTRGDVFGDNETGLGTSIEEYFL